MPAPIICFVLRSRLLDNRVQLGGQEPIDVVRPGDRFRFGAAVALEFGPDAGLDGEGAALCFSTASRPTCFSVLSEVPRSGRLKSTAGSEKNLIFWAPLGCGWNYTQIPRPPSAPANHAMVPGRPKAGTLVA